jgi:hypothetical protein
MTRAPEKLRPDVGAAVSPRNERQAERLAFDRSALVKFAHNQARSSFALERFAPENPRPSISRQRFAPDRLAL